MSGTQRVFRIDKPGPNHSIVASNAEIPSPKSHEVLVKIRAVSLNYRDLIVAKKALGFEMKDGIIPCTDAAGDVVAVGDSVNTLQVGDRVATIADPDYLYGTAKTLTNTLGGPLDGVLREYMVLPAWSLIKIPGHGPIDYAKWAALMVVGMTAWNAFFGATPLRPGQYVLIQGTGGVSMAAVIIAQAVGAVPILTSSSDEKLQEVKSAYGIEHVINYRETPDWSSEVLRITDGAGADFVIENGGPGTIEQSIASVTNGGSIALIGFLSPVSQDKMPNVVLQSILKACIVRGVLIGSRQQAEELVSFFARKELSIRVDKTFGFSEQGVRDAYEYLSSGNHMGKICIQVA